MALSSHRVFISVMLVCAVSLSQDMPPAPPVGVNKPVRSPRFKTLLSGVKMAKPAVLVVLPPPPLQTFLISWEYSLDRSNIAFLVFNADRITGPWNYLASTTNTGTLWSGQKWEQYFAPVVSNTVTHLTSIKPN